MSKPRERNSLIIGEGFNAQVAYDYNLFIENRGWVSI
jgi:hypothetical protein